VLHSILRRVALAILLLTFVSGPWLSVVAQPPPKPCTVMMPPDDAPDRALMDMDDTGECMPCQDGTPVCMERICCFVGATFLAPLPPGVSVLATSVVRYLPMPSRGEGRSIEPELFPPISA
jgi:hypothetical protein